jgi:autotransporter-associated beta strand protein/T5SS/PEP-CTERM-associated repeat protein
MKPKGLAKSLLGTSTLTGAVLGLVASTATAANWTGATNQDWNTLTNWDADPNGVNDTVNVAVGNFPIITATPTFTPVDLFIGSGVGNSGRLDQTAGVLSTGAGNWMWVGEGGGTGTYNLSGTGSLTAGALNVGAWGAAGATGTANINTSGTVDLTAGNGRPFGFGDASLLVGENGSAGTLNLQSGTVNAAFSSRFAQGTGSSATLTISGGTLNTTGEFQFGRSATATGTQTGGTNNSTSFFVIGRDSGAIATYTLSGGTVNAATTSGFTVLGSFSGAQGTLDVSGTGTFNSSVGGMIIGEGGTGTLTVSGSGVVNIGTNGFQLGANASGIGTLNLNGGTLQGGSVFEGAGLGTFNFNGGTLQATAASATFMTGLTAANVQSGGAVIDSNGFAITIAQALLDGGGGGGLTKNGLGTLTLSSAANTYTGATLISNGILATDATGSLGLGNVTVADLAGAGLTLGNGSSIADTATLFFGDAAAITLDNASSDTVFGITQTDDSQSIGAGTFTAAQLNTFFGVTSFGGTGSLTVVPESSSALLGGLGVLGLLRRRRKA